MGLIDTGALGWGPLLFDLAIMLDQIPDAPQAGAARELFLRSYQAIAPLRPDELDGLRHYDALHWAQLARYFAWRLAHQVALGDPDPEGNARSLAEVREALERALAGASDL